MVKNHAFKVKGCLRCSEVLDELDWAGRPESGTLARLFPCGNSLWSWAFVFKAESRILGHLHLDHALKDQRQKHPYQHGTFHVSTGVAPTMTQSWILAHSCESNGE